MDISETYIKMCDCPEIQGRTFIQGDYYGYWYIVEGETLPHGNGWNIWVDSPEYDVPGGIWLPRQDQLQEMVNTVGILGQLRTLIDWCDDPYGFGSMPFPWQFDKLEAWHEHIESLTSMEQLWLAFVMKEKHGKTWNGKEWRDGD